MNGSTRRRLRGAAVLVAVAAPLVGHLALSLGRGYGVALTLAAVQVIAVGVVLWNTWPGGRAYGMGAVGAVLAALAWGAWTAPAAGLLVGAGLVHALLYAALLVVFVRTLWPGRTALLTTVASRLNPAFHAGMVPYTRAVTLAWCLFFAAQLAASATLLAIGSPLWPLLVTTLHAPLVFAMALAEFLVRRWRWRHEHYTSLPDTIRGVRRLMAQRAATPPAPRSATSR